jgi:hypothetical protein
MQYDSSTMSPANLNANIIKRLKRTICLRAILIHGSTKVARKYRTFSLKLNIIL